MSPPSYPKHLDHVVTDVELYPWQLTPPKSHQESRVVRRSSMASATTAGT